MILRTAAVAALSLLSFSLATQAAAQAASGPVTLIQAGRLLDRPGNAPRGNSTIVVRNGAIEAVRDGFVGANEFAGATVVDLRQHFVLPGLIDSHVHLDSDRAGNEGFIEGISNGDAYFAYEALVNARKTLDAGFTSVRNLGNSGGVTLALRDAIAAGKVVGPRILDAGESISTTSGHADGTLGLNPDFAEHAHTGNLCDGVESCRHAVRMQIRKSIDVVKIMTTGGVNSRIGAGLGKQMFDDEAQALIETAHLYGKKVAVHAHGADGINIALKYGADSIEHGTLLDDESIKLFLKSGAYYVPTLSTINGYIERIAKDPNAYPPAVREKIDWRISITGQSLEKAYAKGVKIAFGTDAGVSKHGRNADEFELMVKHGMPPAQAIKAATVNAADLLGITALAGSIEPGKRADIIAVSGDPLTDIKVLKQVSFVMKDGSVVKTTSGSSPRS